MAVSDPQGFSILKLATVISVEWHVENFLAKQASMAEVVDSRPFPSEGLPQWFLQLKPRGDTNRQRKFGVYLKLRKGEGVSVVADYTLKFFNDDGTLLRPVTASNKQFTKGTGWGFIIKEDSNVPIPLADSGKLIVRVDVTINAQSEIPKSSVNEDWLKLQRSGDQADFKLESEDGQTFPVHKAMLSARIPQFNLINSGMKEANNNRMKLPIDAETISALIEYLYGDAIANLSPTVSARLYPVAHQYELDRLLAFCRENLLGNFTVDNVAASMRIGKKFDDAKLKSACERFFDTNKADAFQMFATASYLD